MRDEVYATMFFRHEDVDPDNISALLQLSPKTERVAGEVIEGDRRRDHGYWSIDSGINHFEGINEHLRAILGRLSGRENDLRRFVALSGINPTIHISLYSRDMAIDVDIDRQIIKQIADLEIDLSIDVYFSDNPR